MIYTLVVAGGTGSRMGTDIPKQFLMLENKPIIIYSIEQFLLHKEIDKIFVLVPKDYIEYTKNVIEEYLNKEVEKVIILEGGATRNDTIINGINFIKDNYGITKNDICLTHDAVRPFVTYEIIEENINTALKYGAATTAIDAIDTILISNDNDKIDEIPPRKIMYQCQTPQTFNINLFVDCYEKLSSKEKEILTDATKILVLQNKEVKIVKGEAFNIKITTQHDLVIANSILLVKDLSR
ncbi:2-C-methyl-D-erythritol 4-phosphate cytidylyltransferase [Candidatus Epulonipiscioides gigas]|nr:2-C-methyl-D-erythritol 4-phosphate cytidylyltransferase [Epulopiscium sp. SCG-C07WGA-EpuloA2]